MAETKKEEITKLTIVIEGPENIKQFSQLLAYSLQAGGMAVVDIVANVKKQVYDQVNKK